MTLHPPLPPVPPPPGKSWIDGTESVKDDRRRLKCYVSADSHREGTQTPIVFAYQATIIHNKTILSVQCEDGQEIVMRQQRAPCQLHNHTNHHHRQRWSFRCFIFVEFLRSFQIGSDHLAQRDGNEWMNEWRVGIRKGRTECSAVQSAHVQQLVAAVVNEYSLNTEAS